MKNRKFFIAAAALLLAAILPIGVFAAQSAFSNVEITENTSRYDTRHLNEGGSGNPFSMERLTASAIPSSPTMSFEYLHFGANGANKMYISFSFGAEDPTTLAVYIDEKSDTPACTYEIGNTGGWEKTFAEEFAADISVPGGIHTIIVEFTNSMSGSFSYIRFDEAPVVETETEAETEAPAPVAETAEEVPAVPEPAAQTSDILPGFIIAAVILGSTVVLLRKRSD